MSITSQDILWLIICSALVFFMQPGFACLESGLVRSKNSINVAMKNIIDICIAGLIFWSVGFGLMFGDSLFGVIGSSHFLFGAHYTAYQNSFFLFQFTFCAAIVTLISGATAERMHLTGYMRITVVTALFIYPVTGHWIWAGGLTGESLGWLNQRGFIDFAGGTAVHSVGGWIALACIIIIGPRHLRFNSTTPPRGHNIPLATLGTLILWFGWFGFNGGSLLSWSDAVPKVLVNTTLAAMAGGFVMLLVSLQFRKLVVPELLLNGVLAGLVSITACCHAINPLAAVIIGGIGSAVCFAVTNLLEHYKLDDAIGVIPVHLGPGIWGTIAVALFGKSALLSTGLSFTEQLGMQMLGIVSVAFWAFGVSYFVIKLINHYLPLRVNLTDEVNGLNISEHDTSTEVIDLLIEMEYQLSTGDYTQDINVEPHTEAGQIARQYNRIRQDSQIKSEDIKKMASDANLAKIETEKINTELESKVNDLEKFNQISTERELTIIKLKQKINDLSVKNGNDEIYDLSFLSKFEKL